MIKCKDLVKGYNGKNVLNGINFEISRGQIFGLLGPSGAGKTTLIKAITGLHKYDGGSIEVMGKPVEELSGTDKAKIGIMMDEFGVYERLSCSDNLKIYADIYNVPYSRVDEILEQVGLGQAKKKPASNLSKGMKARLQLARVFMHSPEIIFLDEPTSGLDPQSMKAIHKIINKKKEEGCTIFLTTHNMEEAASLCDEVALLNEGHIVDHGEPKEICRRYNHQKKICIHLKDGRDIEMLHDDSMADKLYEYAKKNEIETIHSSEPNLETVFLEITGRKLQED